LTRVFLADLDGTLLDSLDLILEAFGEALGGGRSREELLSLFGPPEEAVFRAQLGEERFGPALETFYRLYEAGMDRVRVLPGVEELLERLERAGVRMGVVTGKGRRTTSVTLRHLGWEGRFGAVITGDEVSHPKPDPEPLHLALDRLRADPAETVFLGDSAADVRAGRAAGVLTLGAMWGSYFGRELLESRPDRVFHRPEEVADFLLGGK